MRTLLSSLLATLFAAALTAQTTPVAANQTTLTTGMVGLSASQTARLNVVNLSTVPILTPGAGAATSAVGSCSVTLEFYDAQGKLVTNPSAMTTTIAPLAATSLDLHGVSSSTIGRQEFRGVVIAKPAATPIANATAVAVPCTVKVTMEVYDTVSGNTVTLTSDVYALPAVQVTAATKQ